MKFGERSITIKSKQIFSSWSPRLPPPPSLGSQWALSVLFMAGFEAVNKTSFGRHGFEPKQSRFQWWHMRTPDFVIRYQALVKLSCHMPQRSCMDSAGSFSTPQLGISFPAGMQEDKRWRSRLTQCLPSVSAVLSICSDCRLLPTQILWVK